MFTWLVWDRPTFGGQVLRFDDLAVNRRHVGGAKSGLALGAAHRVRELEQNNINNNKSSDGNLTSNIYGLVILDF